MEHFLCMVTYGIFGVHQCTYTDLSETEQDFVKLLCGFIEHTNNSDMIVLFFYFQGHCLYK